MNSQAGALLSNKHAILSTLGTKYNDLYYSAANSSVSLVETTFNWQNKISLPSLAFGSSSQINIPTDQFIQEIILHLRLPATVANQGLCEAWGYACLSSISWILGASNSTQITLQGDSILQTILAQCTTDEKRLFVMQLAGLAAAGVPASPAVPFLTPAQDDVTYYDAYVTIPLPFSTACDKLPMDSTLLSNNISIIFNFAQASAIYGGSGTPVPTQFTVAEVMMRQGKLSNQAASLRQEMIAHPDLLYTYPFIHSSSFVSAAFDGVRESGGFRACDVQLNSFANADLLGITFWVVREDAKVGTASTIPNPYVTDDISNVLVTFNGQTLFDYPGKAYKLTNMMIGEQQASSIPVIVQRSIVSTSNTTWDSYMVFLDFARLRSACMGDHMYNTWRIPNQQLRIQFNTAYGNGTPSSVAVRYRLYATYFYNAVAEFQNGTSAIYIG